MQSLLERNETVWDLGPFVAELQCLHLDFSWATKYKETVWNKMFQGELIPDYISGRNTHRSFEQWLRPFFRWIKCVGNYWFKQDLRHGYSSPVPGWTRGSHFLLVEMFFTFWKVYIHASRCFSWSLLIFLIPFSPDQHILRSRPVTGTELQTLKTKKVMVPVFAKLRVKHAYFNQGFFSLK